MKTHIINESGEFVRIGNPEYPNAEMRCPTCGSFGWPTPEAPESTESEEVIMWKGGWYWVTKEEVFGPGFGSSTKIWLPNAETDRKCAELFEKADRLQRSCQSRYREIWE